LLTASSDNGEVFRSVFYILTLSGGFNVVIVYRLALSRLAIRLHHRLLFLINALSIFYWLYPEYTNVCALSSIIRCSASGIYLRVHQVNP